MSVCVCSLSYPACKAQLLSVACHTLLYFSTLYLKRHDFRKKSIEHKMSLLIFPKILPEHFSF
jgi:hypothetical protein